MQAEKGSKIVSFPKGSQGSRFLSPREKGTGHCCATPSLLPSPTREGEEEEEYIRGISGPDESSDEIKRKELAQLEIVGEAG